jgi:predicted Zn-dependent protease with MMP-like domain
MDGWPRWNRSASRTVIHEVAHHFGIDDQRLSELGW